MRIVNRLLGLSTLPFLFVGCGVTVQNMTPQAMTRNSSGLYPISVEVKRNSNAVLAGSVQPMLILPDQSVPMVPVAGSSNRWEYTVAVPANVNQWPYYFKVNYTQEKALVSYEPRSQLDPENAPAYTYVLRITDRTAVGLDARRARVGSVVKVLGRGFTPNDQVLFNGEFVPTRFENENALSFQVPGVPGNKAYTVEVQDGGSKLNFGDLLVDISQFAANPHETPIALGATAFVNVVIPQPAPPGGLPVSLTVSDAELLDAPATVTIPEGQTSAEVKVKGKSLGVGSISLNAEGFNTGAIPVRVVVARSGK